MVLSDHLLTEFGEKVGCLIKERYIPRRAVFIADRHDMIACAAYMPALGDEPNYGEVLEVTQSLTT
jgi:peroxiredoxin